MRWSCRELRWMANMSNKVLLPEPTWSDDDIYQIYALHYGAPRSGGCTATSWPRHARRPDAVGFQCRGSCATGLRTILVDTGFSPRDGEEARETFRSTVDPVEALTSARDAHRTQSATSSSRTCTSTMRATSIASAKSRFHVQDYEAAFATGRCMCYGHSASAVRFEDVVALVRHTTTASA